MATGASMGRSVRRPRAASPRSTSSGARATPAARPARLPRPGARHHAARRAAEAAQPLHASGRSTRSGTARRRRAARVSAPDHPAVLPPAGHAATTGTGSTAASACCSGSPSCRSRRSDTMRSIIEAAQRGDGCPSFVTVLKRIGPGNPGPLSFPKAGLDARHRHAGRVAARARLAARRPRRAGASRPAAGSTWPRTAACGPSCCRLMYPRLDEWRAVRGRGRPRPRPAADLGRRLGLVAR